MHATKFQVSVPSAEARFTNAIIRGQWCRTYSSTEPLTPETLPSLCAFRTYFNYDLKKLTVAEQEMSVAGAITLQQGDLSANNAFYSTVEMEICS